MTTLQKTVVIATLVAAVGAGIYEARQASMLRGQVQELRQQLALSTARTEQLSRESDGTEKKLAALIAENERPKRDTSELLKLRGEVTAWRRRQDELLNQLAGRNPASPAPQGEVDTAWVQQIVNGLPTDQGAASGALRGKLLRGETTNVSPAEVALRDALLQRKLNQTLERSPVEFADFQTAFIGAALSISDASRIQQVHDLIQQTYEHAVASGLDIPSKPASDTEEWVRRRFELDRAATAQLQQFLTSDERSLFDRAFLGVMGVDMGGVGVDKSNYPKGFLGPE